MKQSWNNVKGLLTRMAEKMPKENYRFNTRRCALVKGDQKAINAGATPIKAQVPAAMKEANDECDAVFNSLSDAEASEDGRHGPRGGSGPSSRSPSGFGCSNTRWKFMVTRWHICA
jgi:hypothetical protein